MRAATQRTYTLIELLVVIAIIVVLVAILLPALSTARSLARQTVCSANLHSLGQAMNEYASTHSDYIPGSPNTSGNGANPGGVGKFLYPGYYHWDPANDAYPAVHIFDWASPMLELMCFAVPDDISERYDQSKRWAFRCPENDWEIYLNHQSRVSIETVVSSYATCQYFTYAPRSKQTGVDPGTIWWTHRFVPEDHFPKLFCIANPSSKVFLADACKVDRGDPRKISNIDYGYTTRGAWLNIDDPETDNANLSYRFQVARNQAFRHRNGLDMLFFDGHVEHHPDEPSKANDSLGSGARQARFWFPSGTDTRKIPSASLFNNDPIIVP